MATRKTGRDLLKNAAAKFNSAPATQTPGAMSGRRSGTDIPASRGVQGMSPGVDGRAAQSFISAPRTVPAAPVRGRKAGTAIPPSQGIQNLSPTARAVVPSPRSALDQATGLMSQRQTEKLAQRVRRGSYGAGPTVQAAQDRIMARLPSTAIRNIELQPSAPTAVNSPPRTTRVMGRLSSGTRAGIAGFAAGIPMAIQAEAQYLRESRKRKK